MNKIIALFIFGLLLNSCGPDRSIEKLTEQDVVDLQRFDAFSDHHHLQVTNIDEPGQQLKLALTFVYKNSKEPLKQHFIYLYQTDSSGNYKPKNPADESTARLGGSAITNSDGQLIVSTILPGDYGNSDDNRHIHTSVYGANPIGYDIHFKQFTTLMGKQSVSNSDQHFLANLKSYDDVLIAFLTIEVKENQPEDEQIVFNSSRNGNGDIFLMNKQGKLIQQLTLSENDQWSPSWINHEELSYLEQVSDQVFRKKINTRTLEIEDLAQPTVCALDDKNMKYSQKKSQAFFGCLPDIYSINLVTKDTTNLTAALEGSSNYISLSEDENKMLFTNNQTGNNDVYQMDLVSGELNNLTSHPANDERGELSPNQDLLAFSTNRFERSAQDIVIQNLSTGSIEKITNSNGYALISRWSKDGKSLYFGSNHSGDWEIYLYELNSKVTSNISQSSGFDGDPQVRP